MLPDPAWTFERIVLEVGPLSQWLVSGLAAAGLPPICIETRHTKAFLEAQPKNLFSPVHVKTQTNPAARGPADGGKLLRTRRSPSRTTSTGGCQLRPQGRHRRRSWLRAPYPRASGTMGCGRGGDARPTPSRKPLPSSRRRCAPRPSGRSPPCGIQSVPSILTPQNAPTTSRPQDMIWIVPMGND